MLSSGVRRGLRIAEWTLVAALIVAGAWLRQVNVAAPSLWWDELVEIRTADRPSVAEVWRAVRDGVAPGTGNAGAAPLDYLALHAWYRVAPAATPETLEWHHRVPALVFSIAALPLAWGLGRVVAGRVAGVALLALLAACPPHVLYAAEARPYSLTVAATFANLLAFAWLLRSPARIPRWVAWAASCLVLVLSALYGVFPIGIEIVALACGAFVRTRSPFASGASRVTGAAGGPGGPWPVAASALGVGVAIALVVLAWLGSAAVGSTYRRPPGEGVTFAKAFAQTTSLFAGGNRASMILFAFALPLAPALCWRRGGVRLALAFVAAAAPFCLVPIIAIAQWKEYYFHPRHVLFLLPTTLLAAAIVAAELARFAMRSLGIAPAGRRFGAALTAAVYALAVASTWIGGYLANPNPSFRAIKTARDFRGIAQRAAAGIASLEPGGRLLLIAERRRAGHLANPVLSYYLDAYRLGGKVILLGTGNPATTLDRFAGLCRGGCPETLGPEVAEVLGAGDPFDQEWPMRRFMRLSRAPWTWGPVDRAGVVTWTPDAAGAPRAGLSRFPLEGAVLDVLRPPARVKPAN